jgi:uncharacterized protein YdeI (YjbR/CyaY-like superfamily)
MGDHPGAEDIAVIELFCRNAEQWRTWLQAHRARDEGVWLIFYRKETDIPSIDYDTALDEALCFGWIDSLIKKIDDMRYARKFTPRRETSKWAPSNKQRVERLIREQRMTAFGLAKIEAARRNGMWEKPDRPEISLDLLKEFRAALEGNPVAYSYFESLPPSYRKQYLTWIAVARRPETRQKRIAEALRMLEKGEKLGLR